MFDFKSLFTTKYLLIGAAIVIGTLGAALGVQTLRIKGLKADIVVITSARDTLQANEAALLKAQDAQTAARTELQSRLDTCVGTEQRIVEANDAAQKQLAAAVKARDSALSKLRAEREKWNASDSTCAAWSRGTLCPAASRGLRNLWSAAEGRGYPGLGGRPAETAGADGQVADGAGAAAGAADPGGLHPPDDCYSNDQAFDALEAVLNAYAANVDKLKAIERAQEEAIRADQRP